MRVSLDEALHCPTTLHHSTRNHAEPCRAETIPVVTNQAAPRIGRANPRPVESRLAPPHPIEPWLFPKGRVAGPATRSCRLSPAQPRQTREMLSSLICQRALPDRIAQCRVGPSGVGPYRASPSRVVLNPSLPRLTQPSRAMPQKIAPGRVVSCSALPRATTRHLSLPRHGVSVSPLPRSSSCLAKRYRDEPSCFLSRPSRPRSTIPRRSRANLSVLRPSLLSLSLLRPDPCPALPVHSGRDLAGRCRALSCAALSRGAVSILVSSCRSGSRPMRL